MNRCKTCVHWAEPAAFSYQARGYGSCMSVKLRESGETDLYAGDELEYAYAESGAFYTGPEFGCVHHKEKT